MAALSLIYSHEDFRAYLAARLDERGARLKLAGYIGCQPSFISQVLSSKNELSLEHAQKINVFFNHSNEEAQYFIQMVLLSKAGSFELQKFFREQLRDIREKQMQIHKVVVKSELHRDDLLYYYSNWLCVSIHMLVSIAKYQDPVELRAKLGVEEAEFMETMNFLTRTGLVQVVDGKLETGEAHVHLKKTSPYAQSATILTRLKVLEKIKLSNPRAVNFTSNFTISRKGYEALRKTILDFVVQLDEHIQAEDPEEFCTLVLDLIEH
jgi:uncharacterized protein (TIGR02147 family)